MLDTPQYRQQFSADVTTFISHIDVTSKIIFAAACGLSSDFQQLWNVSSTTKGHVLVASNTQTTRLGVGMEAWRLFLQQLARAIVSTRRSSLSTSRYRSATLRIRTISTSSGPSREQTPVGISRRRTTLGRVMRRWTCWRGGLRHRSNKWRSAAALAAFVMMLGVGGAVPAAAPGDAIAWAQEFLRAVQPDLMGKRAILQVMCERAEPYVPFAGQYAVILTDTPFPGGFLGSDRPSDGPFARPPGKVFLHAGFTFVAGGRLFSYIGYPTAIREKEAAYDRLIRAHPEWSETDAARALTVDLGARFGPSDAAALRQQLPLAQLEALMGKIRVTEEPSLVLRAPRPTFDDNKRDYAGVPQWGMRLVLTGVDGTEHQYNVIIEPFEGRIVDIFH